jgi:hypothetical protein
MRQVGLVFCAVWLATAGSTAGGGVAPQNVLVLYNPAWTDGTHGGSYLANYYAAERNVPANNVIGITGLGTGEEISAADYLNIVQPQVQAAVNALNIDVIVTTKGLPLRIRNDMPNPDPGIQGYTYTDAAGVQRTLYGDCWRRYSSLESELTRVTSIGVRNGADWLNTALLQMGDQTWWTPVDPGDPPDPAYPNPARNPYYQSTSSFSHADPAMGGMRLTARLDGFTVSNVVTAINKAGKAFVNKGTYIVMDNDPSVDIADRTMVQQLRDNTINPLDQACVYDNSTAAVTTAPGPVAGYVSHGVHSAALQPGYVLNQLAFQLANGAVFDTHESFNAYSFQPGGNLAGQGLLAEWLARGGTAGVGQVQEPYNGPENLANEDQMFKMLLSGYTWGEAAWSSLQQLSYVNTVAGDPLMVWRSGTGIQDLSQVLRFFNSSVGPWGSGDYNGDGSVDIADLSIVLTNYDRTSMSSKGVRPAPEPSGTILLVTVAVLFGLRAMRRWPVR